MLRLTEGRLTAAVLIQLTVEERLRERAALHILPYLSADIGNSFLSPTTSQESATAEGGRVLSPARLPVLQVEKEKALCAFELKHYFLLIDKHHIKALDEEITLTANTQVQFLRLIPLVGG